MNLIDAESSDLCVGVMAALNQAGRGKMKNGVPLTEIVCSCDFDEVQFKQVYDPNCSLKLSIGLPPIETGQGRIELMMDVKNGLADQVTPAREGILLQGLHHLLLFHAARRYGEVAQYGVRHEAEVTGASIRRDISVLQCGEGPPWGPPLRNGEGAEHGTDRKRAGDTGPREGLPQRQGGQQRQFRYKEEQRPLPGGGERGRQVHPHQDPHRGATTGRAARSY